MLAYFDTASFVPMLIDEPGTARARQLWSAADSLASTRLLHVEAVAALQRAVRTGRIDRMTFRAAFESLEAYWLDIQVIELDDSLMRLASQLAAKFGLRGYDATHCAAAYSAFGPDTVAVSGDDKLLTAWSELGLATARV